MSTQRSPKSDVDESSESRSEPERTGQERDGGAPRRGRGRRRRRNPEAEDELNRADEEDGIDRNIDPREAGAEIYDDHGLPPDGVDPDAAKVIRRLVRYGFQAYLVGGCVRDLLLGLRPKDFDIATSATPRQIKRLFRNSRVIGRRFRLVHIHFGDHILEVSTFRRNVPKEEGEDPLIRRDNTFGRADEDAQRRDFTINALFYDLHHDEVIDFVGGMPDIRRRRLEVIGDPVTRLREDPVRMLRAAKFAGRLRLELADDLFDAIQDVREDLAKAAAPRLFEELQRLLNRGGAYGAFQVLYETGALENFLPELDEYLQESTYDVEGLSGPRRFWNCLKSLDRYVLEGRPTRPSLLLAALFCHLFDRALHHSGQIPSGENPSDYDIGAATDNLLKPLGGRLQMPRRDLYQVRQLVIALRRFLSRRTSRKPSPNQLVRKEYFPDALRLFEVYSTGIGRYQGEVVQWQRRWAEVHGRPFV